jgi:hypothetical protein
VNCDRCLVTRFTSVFLGIELEACPSPPLAGDLCVGACAGIIPACTLSAHTRVPLL